LPQSRRRFNRARRRRPPVPARRRAAGRCLALAAPRDMLD